MCVVLLNAAGIVPMVTHAQQTAYTTTQVTPAQAFLRAQLELIMIELLKIQVLIEALREAETEQGGIAANTEEDIVAITAEIDYVAEETRVTTRFEQGSPESFTIDTVAVAEVESALRDRYDVSSRELERVLQVSEVNADVLVAVVVEMRSSRSISITQVAANGDDISQQIPTSLIDGIISNDFAGLGNVYDALIDGYARDIRSGDIPDGVIGLVAQLMRLPVTTIEPIIEFEVSRSYRDNANS